MEDYQLLLDLHKSANRQGPGGDAETEKALSLAMIDRTAPLKIADIGCGTGSSALLLASLLNAQVKAVDLFQDFIEVLEGAATHAPLATTRSPSLRACARLPFGDEEYDVIWSEGAIYNIGFERGVKDWNRYLKAGGLLVVSEITWTTASHPSELQRHWEGEYPEIDTASSKIGVMEKSGYSPIGYFVLPEHCWLENYYWPMQNSFSEFLSRNANNEEAQAIVEAEKKEISLYKRYKNYYSYGVYVARKMG